MNAESIRVQSSDLCISNSSISNPLGQGKEQRGSNLKKPQQGDMVLGHQACAAQGSVVLGGMDRLRRGLSALKPELRVLAMREALDRGETGLLLLLQTPFREQAEQLFLLETSLELWNRWRQQHLNVLVQFDLVDFSSNHLPGVDWRNTSLHKASLVDADLQQADLRNASLCEADLIGVNLQKANLQGADLSSADLRGANLQDADFTGAYLGWADLATADIRRANFSQADLHYACLRGTYLKGADFTDARMPDGHLNSFGTHYSSIEK